MKKTFAALAGAVALVAPFAAAVPGASAETYTAPEVASTFNLHVKGDTAYVQGKYRCDDDTVMSHLWVSAKQGDGVTGEGTPGSAAAAWYDTNISRGGTETEPGPEIPLTCDGDWHVARVALGRYPDKELLQAGGEAWVQFCLYTMDETGFMGTSSNRWLTVKR